MVAAGSPGQRNELGESFGRCLPIKSLARAAVQLHGDGVEVFLAKARQARALREVLAQQPVGVLVGTSLPGAMRVAKVDVDPRRDAEQPVLGHLASLVPGERAP